MKKSGKNLMAAAAACLMLLGLVLSVCLIAMNVESGAVKRAGDSLLNGAAAQGTALKTALKGQIETLGLVAESLSDGDMNKSSVVQKLDAVLPACSCEGLSYVSTSGATFSSTGNNMGLPGRQSINSALSGVNAVQRSHDVSSDKARVYILVPCVRDGYVSGALIAAYREENLRAILTDDVTGNGFSVVIDSGGNIVIRSREQTLLSNYSNILNYLAKAVFEKGYTRSDTLDNLSRGKSGIIRYIRATDSFMAAYVPVRDENIAGLDWFILDIMDSARLTSEIDSGKRESMTAVAVFASFSILALAAFIIYGKTTNRRLINDTNLVRMREERYRLVVAESGREVFQYDIASGAVHRDNILYDYFGEIKDISNWDEFFANSGAADPDGVALMRGMFSRIDMGESPVTLEIKLSHPAGGSDWNRFHANTIYGGDGKPVTAVVSYFNCTYLHEREAAYHKWLDEAKRLDKEFIARFNWNVTKDAMEEARYEAHPMLCCDGLSMEKWAGDYAGAHVVKEDRAAYRRFFETERLLGAFEHGTDSESLDYRESVEEGYRWLRITAQLTKHPQSGDVKARLLYQNIDEAKRKELEIIAKGELDSLTGAFNREALMRKVERLIAQNPSASHAVLMIDADGFKAVNDILGHDEGDNTLKALVNIIRGCLRGDDIVGRIGGDEIMVVLKDIPYEAVIRKKARQLCQALSMRVKDKVDITVSIGIALYPRDASGYEELYKRADVAMYKAKANGKNGYFFYNQFALQLSGRLNDKFDESCAGTDNGKNDLIVVYAGDSEENARLAKEALSPEARIVVTDNMRRAIVAMRCEQDKRCAAIIDFEALERELEVITACSSDGSMRRVALIAAINPGDSFAIERVMNAGASDYIVRPFAREDIDYRVNASLIRLKRDASFYGAKYRDSKREEDESGDAMLRAMNSAMVVYDLSNGLFYYNSSVERTLAGAYDDRPFWRILLSDMVARSTDVKQMQSMVSRLANNPDSPRDEMNVTLKTASGERRFFRFQAIRSGERQNAAGRILLVFTDINDSVEKSDKLIFKAERDSLTGLYNADTFFERAGEMIKKKSEGFYTVLAIDMDNFKSINNQFGRNEGNKVLCALSERLSRAAHTGGGIVCRVAGDNFAVLCQTQSVSAFENALDDCSRSGERYRDYFATAIHAGRYAVTDKAMAVNDMYDRAMIAKSSIKYRYDVHIADFSEEMLLRLLKEQSIVGEMDAALSKGQFEVWYQPQYSIANNVIIGAEALVRWRRPNHGLVSPSEYIPLFESNGFIYKLDRFVWHSVAKSISERARKGFKVVPVSVNVSRCDIHQPDFYEVMTAIPSQYGIDARLIRLEITESAISSLSGDVISLIERLRKFGFEILIDDFGSGYSSLGILKDMATDAIKLDSSLLNSAGESPRADKVMRSVMGLAKLLDVPVIAEGVEKSEQVEYLRALGCHFVQGYIYSQPVPMLDFEGLMDSGRASEQ